MHTITGYCHPTDIKFKSKCFTCAHSDVCSHKEEMEKLINKVNEMKLLGEENSIFNIDINCVHFMDMPTIATINGGIYGGDRLLNAIPYTIPCTSNTKEYKHIDDTTTWVGGTGSKTAITMGNTDKTNIPGNNQWNNAHFFQ